MNISLLGKEVKYHPATIVVILTGKQLIELWSVGIKVVRETTILYPYSVYRYYSWVAITNNEQYPSERTLLYLSLNVAMELLIITYAILRKATYGNERKNKSYKRVFHIKTIVIG